MFRGFLPQHVGHDKEAHVAAPDVDLFQMAHAAVPRGDGDVFELDIHVILGWRQTISFFVPVSAFLFAREANLALFFFDTLRG